MYERSAIVLERYLDTLLCLSNEFNLRDNFDNYCDLVFRLEKYQVNYQKEYLATQDFNKSLKKVKAIQTAQEKLYKKSVQLEYNRNLLFNNIEGKVEDTKKCIEKIESDIEKVQTEMVEKKIELLDALAEYNNQRFELSKCKRYKKMAENDYNDILKEAQVNFEGISEEALEYAKAFSEFDDEEEILALLQENGKGEKIPFNEGVMQNATELSVSTSKKLVQSYLSIYDKMERLLTDISTGTAKVELHKKYAKNEKAKVDVLLGIKDYIVQFLDYERMTVIHGRKSHNRLMGEACDNFATDVVQINNLFELLVKEITNKATKKAYKELYNKSYLIDIQDKEEKFKKEKNRVNLNTATLINSNYWRIEGIQNIYTIFYKIVTEVFGRDVAEFDLPKMLDEDVPDVEEAEIVVNEKIKKEESEEPVKADIPFEIFEGDMGETLENSLKEQAIEETEEVETEEESEEIENEDNKEEATNLDEGFDIFGEKYQDIDVAEVTRSLGLVPDEEKEDEEEDSIFDDEEEDDEIVDIKKAKRKKENEIEDFDLNKEDKGSIMLKKIRKISSVKKRKSESEIW